jgi:UDP-N-acetylmuramyl pentapeptide phosphotransferase/UDP-N-acetylglucosamine-1-phosphate transferase
MKALFWIGMVVLILGIVSFVVPIPRNEREGFKAGGISIGVETRHSERVSPIVGGVMILAGAGMMIAGKRRS